MPRYVFDIETNELEIEKITRIHVICIKNADTGEAETFRGGDVSQAVYLLNDADEIIGHNIIKFDVRAIQHLYPNFKPVGKITDTLVLSRLLYPDIGNMQFKGVPSKLKVKHSLEAWGYRLGNYKGDFHGPWDECTDEMVTYCEQDVNVTFQLYHRLMSKKPSEMSVTLEHEFATIMAKMEEHGFAFDVDAATKLLIDLTAERLELRKQLQDTFPPEPVSEEFIPKKDNAKRGYKAGVPVIKTKLVVFNPSSRPQIVRRLKALGWEPNVFTDKGQAKVDDSVLNKLPYPEAKLLARYFLVEKRIGQLSEGEQGWLRQVTNKGRIHGAINPNGAVTGRCTHSNPNIAQVPKVGKPFGKECRSLFTASKGKVLVGIDLSGLELRCLAHFMARYDNGEYGKIVIDGDVHSLNQAAAGLPTRDNAKTFIYAYLYGAGDQKIGSIVKPLASVEDQKRVGKKLKKAFLDKTPALASLRKAVEIKVKEKGKLIGLDGRVLRIRSAHAALNTLLQSAGALIAKQATVLAYRNLSTLGYVFGKDWALVAHIHDEMQIEAKPEIAEVVGKVVVQSMQQAGEFFGFRVPITGEWKIGNNWADTH